MNFKGLLFLVGFFVAGICCASEPVVTFGGFERPIVGAELSAMISGGDWHKYSWVWERADQARTKYVLKSEASRTTVKDWDLEQWLRVTVKYDGEVIASKEVWISTIPVVYLTTDSGEPVATKDFYVPASLRIQGSDEFEQQYDGITEVKGRGNSSWRYYPQKPYKLKLDKKTDLFGFGKNKHWVLIPSFSDKCGLRNKLGGELARAMGLLAMDMTWVEVVLNGEYHGFYMLAEHIRIDENRLQIFDWEAEGERVADELYAAVKKKDKLSSSDKSALEKQLSENFSWITTGKVAYGGKTYTLADYDITYSTDFSGGFLYVAEVNGGGSHFSSPGGVPITVDLPEFAKTDTTLYSAAKNIWIDFEAAFSSPDGRNAKGRSYTELADLESMAAMMLLNEIMINNDPANSRYSYVDQGGKIIFGPAWDYDYTSGVWGSIFVDKGRFSTLLDRADNYCRHWVNDPYFCRVLYDVYWQKARPYIDDLLSKDGEFDRLAAAHAKVGLANDERWMAEPWALHPEFPRRSYADDVKEMKRILSTHIAWLDECFESFPTLMQVFEPYRRIPSSTSTKLRVAAVDCSPITSDGCFAAENGLSHVIVAAVDATAKSVDFIVDGIEIGSASVYGGYATFEAPNDAFRHAESYVTVVSRDAQGKFLARNFALLKHVPSLTYSLKYELDGGVAPYTLPMSAPLGGWLSLPTPRKQGAIFYGWQVVRGLNSATAKVSAKSGVMDSILSSSQILGRGSSCSLKNLAQNGETVTLRAVWRENSSYLMDYELNGGYFTATPPTYSPTNAWVTVVAPAKEGCVFAGWKVSGEVNFTKARYSIATNTRVTITDSETVCGVGYERCSFNELAQGGRVVRLTACWTVPNRGVAKTMQLFAESAEEKEPLEIIEGTIHDNSGYFICVIDPEAPMLAQLLIMGEEGQFLIECRLVYHSALDLAMVDEEGYTWYIQLGEVNICW